MLGLWGIDDDVVAAVAYHHKPGNFPGTQFTAVTAVYVANTGLPEGMSKEPPPPAECIDLDCLTTPGLTERLPDREGLCVPPEKDAA
jgi:hypothetical protein